MERRTTAGATELTTARAFPVPPVLAAFGALAALAGLVGCLAGAIHPSLRDSVGVSLPVVLAVAWGLFALGAALLLRVPVRQAVPLLLAGGLALQVVALTAPPASTTDIYRYVWDGRVQAAGIDPYAYPPVAPELAELRESWLFPPGRRCEGVVGDCPVINRADERTAYPPVAQVAFLVVHLLAPDARQFPFQLLGAGCALLVAALLVSLLRRGGRDPRLAVLWAWCPLVPYEAGNAAHVDALATLLALAALAAAAQDRASGPWKAGAWLGAATGTKLVPLLLAPVLLRGTGVRRALAVAGGLGAVLALAYLPHVVAVGGRALGFLPGYLREEGYVDGGGRFVLLGLVLPDAVAPVAAVVVVAAAAVAAARVTRRAPPDGDAAASAGPGVVVLGVALLAATPTYPWYGLLLAALVPLSGRPEWLAVAAAGYPAYLAPVLSISIDTGKVVGYAAALAVVAGVTLARSAARPAPHQPAGMPGRPPRTRQ